MTALSLVTELATPLSGTDLFYVVDNGTNSRRITWTNILVDLTALYAATGANSDITSLAGLTTALTVAQGGSGAATLTGILLGNGTAAFTAITNNSTAWNAAAPAASPTFTGTVTLPTGLTGVIRADSGVVSVDGDVTDIVTAASTTAAGKIEVAIASELNTGTDATRAVSPDSLAGSNFGTQVVQLLVFDDATDVATGNGAGDLFFRVPSTMNGMDLVAVAAQVQTAGTTGTTDIQIYNVTQAADMLTTVITIDSTETDSLTAAAAAAIDATNDDVATGDQIRIDVDAVSTTAPKGLLVELQFRLP